MIHGGFGLYHDWVTLGNVQNEFANPPAPVGEVFQANATPVQPLYSVGTSDTWPFGLSYPVLPAGSLNSVGTVNGTNPPAITGNDPNLKASNTLNYAATLEHGLGRNYSVAVGYAGEHSQ